MKSKATPSKLEMVAIKQRKAEIKWALVAITAAAMIMVPTYFLFDGLKSTAKHSTNVTVADKGYRKGLGLHGTKPTVTYKREDGHVFTMDVSPQTFASLDIGNHLVISVSRGDTKEVKASESWIFFGGMISTAFSLILSIFGVMTLIWSPDRGSRK